MKGKVDVDEMIRQALAAEDAEGIELPGEPGWLATLTGVFRSQMRWFGAMFMFMVMTFFGLAVYCGWRFLNAPDDAGLIRWGLGLLFCTIVALNGKVWYWMETGRLATVEEVKRLELLVAHLACELRERTPR